MNTPEQFWKHVKIGGPDECWPWIGALSVYGYPQLVYDGKAWRGNRLAWTLKHGPIPDGAMICHTCDSRSCCNDAHLYPGSARDNWEDGITHGVNPFKRGKENYCGKLEPGQIHEIRLLRRSGMTQQQIADKFGVSRPHIANIFAGRCPRIVPNVKCETA